MLKGELWKRAVSEWSLGRVCEGNVPCLDGFCLASWVGVVGFRNLYSVSGAMCCSRYIAESLSAGLRVGTTHFKMCNLRNKRRLVVLWPLLCKLDVN